MKLIFLYGPPAAGKFTVAKELARTTGFKLLHNHLVADLASSIFDYGTKEYADLATELRLLTLHAAISSKAKGLVLTYTYGVETWQGKDDAAFVRQVIRMAKRARVKIYFVKLECDATELNRRVRNPSRKKFNKLTDPKILKSILKKFPVADSIPGVKSFAVNTTLLTPRAIALIIRKHYRI